MGKEHQQCSGFERLWFASENGTVPDRFNLGLDYGNMPTTRRHRFLTTFAYQIPMPASLMSNNISKRALGGWEMGGILLMQTGPFLTPTIASTTDPSGTNSTQRASDRPDYAPGYTGYGNSTGTPTVDQWFDPKAVAIPASNIGRFGLVGPGQLVGPATRSLSVRVTKKIDIFERMKLQLEAMAVNVTNTANFANPSLNVSNSNFGRVTSTLGVDNGGARNIQIGARVTF